MKQEAKGVVRLIGLAVWGWILFGFAGMAMADGGFYSEKAFAKKPTIPVQRAVLVYKGGVETLTIESALEAEGKQFGWVIPLPNVPTKFEKSSPGFLKTLSLVVGPKIGHDYTGLIILAGQLAVLVTIWSLILWLTGYRLLDLLLLIVISELVVSTMMPALGGAGMSPAMKTEGVMVREAIDIGSYSIQVVEAQDAGALSEWLEENGFRGLTEEDRNIVEDYIAKKWCFVTAKLKREGPGFSRPHPLTVSFETSRAVYPMRLTGQTGAPVYLELYVIAESRARHPSLRLEFADQYYFSKGYLSDSYESVKYHEELCHPKAFEVMWDGCVVSKLCSTLQPSQMKEDFYLERGSAESERMTYYSQRGARGMGLVLALLFWSAGLPISIFLFLRRKQYSGRKALWARYSILICVFAAGLIWLMTYLLLPKIEVVPQKRYFSADYLLDVRSRDCMYYSFLQDCFKGKTFEQMEESIRDYFAYQVSANPFTGERVKAEDSPGDYTLIQEGNDVFIQFYYRNGKPLKLALTRKEWHEEKRNPNEEWMKDIMESESRETILRGLDQWKTETEKKGNYGESLADLMDYYRAPQTKTLIPTVLEQLRVLYQSQRDREIETEGQSIPVYQPEVEVLSILTRTVPPVDLKNEKAMNEFIEKIQAWSK